MSQQRDAASMVLLAEAGERHAELQQFHIHAVLKGDAVLGDSKSLNIPVVQPVDEGKLVLAFAIGTGDIDLQYKLIPADETRFAYLVQAPSLRASGQDRLKYFAKFVAHPDELISQDAFDEFAIAPYDDVRSVVGHLPLDHFRRWIVDEQVPGERRGFLGLVLGLEQGNRRAENRATLRGLVRSQEGEFRAGFDGILAGYLLCGGSEAVDDVTARYFTDSSARVLDVRHAMSAVRFYHPHATPEDRVALQAAVRRLLLRPEVAAAAIADLARWQDWESLEAVVDALERSEEDADDVRRAACCFLVVCPTEAAQKKLAQLRPNHGVLIEAAEVSLGRARGES